MYENRSDEAPDMDSQDSLDHRVHPTPPKHPELPEEKELLHWVVISDILVSGQWTWCLKEQGCLLARTFVCSVKNCINGH